MNNLELIAAAAAEWCDDDSDARAYELLAQWENDNPRPSNPRPLRMARPVPEKWEEA